jgi:internalin A
MVSIHSGDVIDLTPLRVFKDLEQLECVNNRVGDRGPLDDLRPLAGMRLKRLDLSRNTVGDLTPLKGMPLEHLNCQVTGISDLSPLKEIKTLKTLSCHGTIVRDLTPLKDLKNLRQLDCGFSQVGDLSPLKGLQLEKLHIVGCGELDLEPLRGMPLIVFDYELRLNREMDVEIVKSMPKLKEIRGKPAAEVLKGGN